MSIWWLVPSKCSPNVPGGFVDTWLMKFVRSNAVLAVNVASSVGPVYVPCHWMNGQLKLWSPSVESGGPVDAAWNAFIFPCTSCPTVVGNTSVCNDRLNLLPGVLVAVQVTVA